MRKGIVVFAVICLVVANLLLVHCVLWNCSDKYAVKVQEVWASFHHPKIKIFMTYYKPFRLPKKGEIVQPIQVGRAIETEPFMGGKLSDEDRAWLHENMIGDDSGDNISAKNRSFDVLTAYYWVWKHYREIGNPEYIGFWAHSKILILTPTNKRLFNRLAPNYGLDEKKLLKLLEKHKVVTWAWTPYIYEDGETIISSAYDNYRHDHVIEDLDRMVDMVKEKYPEMTDAVHAVLYDIKPQPIWNYFVMEKELAFDYFSKLFALMFELEKNIGAEINARDYKQRRAFGFLAERFFAIWLEYQTRKGVVSPLFVPQQYL